MDLPRHWRLRQARYRLQGTRCEDCGNIFFPGRSICPECRSENVSPHQFAGHGQVYSYTTVHQAPAGFAAYVPYTVALVQLEEGPLVTAQLTDLDPEDAYIGMKVETVIRKLKETSEDDFIVYGYKFRPRLDSAGVGAERAGQ